MVDYFKMLRAISLLLTMGCGCKMVTNMPTPSAISSYTVASKFQMRQLIDFWPQRVSIFSELGMIQNGCQCVFQPPSSFITLGGFKTSKEATDWLLTPESLILWCVTARLECITATETAAKPIVSSKGTCEWLESKSCCVCIFVPLLGEERISDNVVTIIGWT